MAVNSKYVYITGRTPMQVLDNIGKMGLPEPYTCINAYGMNGRHYMVLALPSVHSIEKKSTATGAKPVDSIAVKEPKPNAGTKTKMIKEK